MLLNEKTEAGQKCLKIRLNKKTSKTFYIEKSYFIFYLHLDSGSNAVASLKSISYKFHFLNPE